MAVDAAADKYLLVKGPPGFLSLSRVPRTHYYNYYCYKYLTEVLRCLRTVEQLQMLQDSLQSIVASSVQSGLRISSVGAQFAPVGPNCSYVGLYSLAPIASSASLVPVMGEQSFVRSTFRTGCSSCRQKCTSISSSAAPRGFRPNLSTIGTRSSCGVRAGGI